MTKSKGQTTNDKNKLTFVKNYGFYVIFVYLKTHHVHTISKIRNFNSHYQWLQSGTIGLGSRKR